MARPDPPEGFVTLPPKTDRRDGDGNPAGSKIFRALLLTLLLGIAGMVLDPYIVPLLWSAVFAFATFPLLLFLRRFVPGPLPSSLLMTGLFMIFVLVPVLSFALPLSQEALSEAGRLQAFLANPRATLPPWIDHLPIIGPRVEHGYQDFRSHTPNVSILFNRIQTHLLTMGDKLFSIMTDAGKILIKTLILLLGLFSFYMKGPSLWRGIRSILVHFGGPSVEIPFAQIAPVTRGVVYGMFFTALTQAILAGVGFGAAGIPEALLLTILLFFTALFPMGAVAVWLPASFILLAQGRTLAFILFLVWNALVVGGIENVIKPIFIGRSSEMPFILILLGVLGGLEAFGIIGLFIGPVILAILQTLWHEHTGHNAAPPPPEG